MVSSVQGQRHSSIAWNPQIDSVALASGLQASAANSGGCGRSGVLVTGCAGIARGWHLCKTCERGAGGRTMPETERLQQIRALLADDPADPFLRYGLAMEYAGQGDDATAARHFRDLITASPEYVP